MIKKAFILFLLLLSGLGLSAQCLYPVSLSERISQSSLIAEGQVISSSSFWNTLHTNIYTSHKIEVSKVWKGILPASSTIIEVVTQGGVVDDRAETVNPSLQLQVGDIGVFLLHRAFPVKLSSMLTKPGMFLVYADQQGFIKYDLAEGTGSDVFNLYSVTDQLYPLLTTEIGLSTKVINRINWFKKEQVNFSTDNAINFGQGNGGGVNFINQVAPTITSFSPSTITSGTGSILTITGTAFGASQGNSVVSFKNADDGGNSFTNTLSSQYVSWSNTEIKVKVPADAGTGVIRVTVSGISGTSSDLLTVSYSNLNYETINGDAFITDHVNDNGSGGYTFLLHTEFNDNSAAKAAFLRALQSWRCSTFMNWEASSTPTTTDASVFDNMNVIRFDNGSELPAGVLGQCRSYWTSCSNIYYVSELDIIFDDNADWEFGPALASGSKYDFESVMLHELGHAHQLGHIIDITGIMNFSISNGSNKRVLSANDIDGGENVMQRSLVANSCGPGKITALNSSNCSITAPVASVTIAISSGNNPSCDGEDITFLATVANGGGSPAYQWKKNGLAIAGEITNSYSSNNFVNKDTITCVMTSNLAGVSNSPATSNKIGLTINPIPTADFTVNLDSTGVNKNIIVTYIGTASAGATYNWDFDGAMINSGTGKGPYSVKWTTPGNKSIILSVTEKNCSSTQVSKQIKISPASTGIDQASIEKLIKVYPNPTTGIVTVSNLVQTPIEKVELYDLNGKKLPVYYDISNNPNQQINLTLTHLANAEYIIRLYMGSRVLNYKIYLSR